MTTLAQAGIRPDTRHLIALAAGIVGLMIFLTAGFAAPQAIHNATHDVRHSMGLPCH